MVGLVFSLLDKVENCGPMTNHLVWDREVSGLIPGSGCSWSVLFFSSPLRSLRVAGLVFNLLDEMENCRPMSRH